MRRAGFHLGLFDFAKTVWLAFVFVASMLLLPQAGFCDPISINSQPADQNVLINSSVTFSVGVAGDSPVYQWQKNGTNLFDGGMVSGSTSPNLTLSSVLATNAGAYQVIVTNLSGSVTSTPAILSVVPVVVWGSGAAVGIAPPSATNVVAIAVGAAHALALRADGTVVGWGDSSWGEITIPPEATNVVAIAVGELEYSFAVRADGVILGWGYDVYGETNPPANATNMVAASGHTVDGMGLRADGTATGWGYDYYGITETPAAATNLVAISLGADYDVGLRSDGQVVGWGYNDFGAPIIPAGLTNGMTVSAGWLHAMALRAGGTVLAWGNNGWGQTNVPANATNVIAIAAGHSHSLALRADGSIVGWGDNSAGQLTVPALATNAIAIGASGTVSGALLYDPSAIVSPRFGRQPQGQDVPAGRTVIFHPVVLGSPPLRYQWFHDNVLMAGQTNAWLALPNVGLSDMGNYVQVATNQAGPATSQPAALTVGNPPAILAQPAGQSVLLTSNVTFTVPVSGTTPLSYQWYFNGAPLTDNGHVSGSTTTNLAIAGVVTNDAATYQLVITNNYGMVTSTPAALAVLVPVAITVQPTNRFVLISSNVSLTVGVVGTSPLSFQWSSNGIPIANGVRFTGATNATLNIAAAQTNDTAMYQVIITNNYGSATSALATLTVLAPAKIISQPASQSALLNSTVSFPVTVSGSALSFQWYFNNAPLSDAGRISGSSTATLTINNVQSTDAGAYSLVVSNLLSSVTSLNATLTPQNVLVSSMRYVSLIGTNPTPPYLDWTTAATNIQDAVDAAVAGDTILVSNGVYQTGSRIVFGSATNRVAVYKPLTVQSVNGPTVTLIQGINSLTLQANIPIRCIYLTNGAMLSGFTLTNGSSPRTGDFVKEQCGGGAWCESSGVLISNCVITGNSATRYGGGVFQGVLWNCLLTNNAAMGGGGACSNQLINCTLVKNSIVRANLNLGGGALASTLTNCVLVGNTCPGSGGGAALSTLTSCVLSNNTSSMGGAAFLSALNNSLISSNRASSFGGGASSNVMNNCLLQYNVASETGGGAYNSILLSCTVVSNQAPASGGGGMWGGAVTNSIVYFNGAGGNIVNSKLVVDTCSTPFATFTNDPLFVNPGSGDFHLQSNSPCINSGLNTYAIGTADLDGNPRIVAGTIDVGAYEFQTPGSILSYLWAQQYGLPTDGSADYADLDGTGMNNWQKWIAGLNPTNPASVLVMHTPSLSGLQAGTVITWQSVSNRTYYLLRSTNLAAQPPFIVIQSNLLGHAGTTSYSDTSATNSPSFYYRIGVQ